MAKEVALIACCVLLCVASLVLCAASLFLVSAAGKLDRRHEYQALPTVISYPAPSYPPARAEPIGPPAKESD